MYFFNIDGLHIPECYLVKIEEIFFLCFYELFCFTKKETKTQVKHPKLQILIFYENL